MTGRMAKYAKIIPSVTVPDGNFFVTKRIEIACIVAVSISAIGEKLKGKARLHPIAKSNKTNHICLRDVWAKSRNRNVSVANIGTPAITIGSSKAPTARPAKINIRINSPTSNVSMNAESLIPYVVLGVLCAFN